MITAPNHFGRLLVEGTTVRPVLPDWHELLAAFCGHIGDDLYAHPITQCARALAELHHASREHPDTSGFRATCAVLVTSIDAWVALHAPYSDRCPESLGEAVEQMAIAQLRANELLRSSIDGKDERLHAAWHRLASLADGWTDLVSEVVDGQPRPKDRKNP